MVNVARPAAPINVSLAPTKSCAGEMVQRQTESVSLVVCTVKLPYGEPPLVESRQREWISACDAEQPVSEDALVVREVRNDVLERPFSGRVGHAVDIIVIERRKEREQSVALPRRRPSGQLVLASVSSCSSDAPR